jgi:hypothetical protein
MSFRKEEKVIFHISDYNKLKNLIFRMKGKIIYPKRHIKSIYFDNNKNKIFFDSEEGSVPRTKLRVRTYPKNNIDTEWYFEKKINSAEGKFKVSKKITKDQYENFLKFGIFDKTYGNCYLNLYVEYIREYFVVSNIRITLDQSIKYKSFLNNKIIKKVDKMILEYKFNNLDPIEVFDGKIPFQFSRMSKYCDGFNELFNLPHFQRETRC